MAKINNWKLNDMRVDCMKGNDTSETHDHISELPDDILCFILSLVDLRNAVTTRILSSRWRYLSASTYNLNFDLRTMFALNYDEAFMDKNYKWLWDVAKPTFIKRVNQFLQTYRGPKKMKSLRISYGFRRENTSDIDRWISFAVQKDVEKIDLLFSFKTPDRIYCFYTFPCHLFPQGESSRLKHLCLGGCTLKPTLGLTNCLNSLKTLDLKEVGLDQGDFDNILFGCRDLETLQLKECLPPATFCICGQSPSLKVMVLNHCKGARTIEFYSVRLATFEYIGLMINLTFIGVPRIEKMHMWIWGKSCVYQQDDECAEYMFSHIAKVFPQLQIMSLVLSSSEVFTIPANMAKFSHLKELELFLRLDSFDLLSIIPILYASPLLQKLHLALSGRSHYISPRKEKKHCEHHYHELKEVEISGFSGEENSMKLAAYLL